MVYQLSGHVRNHSQLDVNKPLKYNADGVLSYGSDSPERRNVEFNSEVRIVSRKSEKPIIGDM